ncbi:MAG: heme ABC exporter ATP-binding protein CcmA [Halieaceae bacterium]|jgi:heme exporter protein A|nr:heme ABC exporter ATP-binding protein CcmA [Halieaceae bacterium]
MPDALPLVTLRGLALQRGGRTLLCDLDLNINAGQLLLIEGENGSGKTTLLRCLAGLSSLGRSGSLQRDCDEVLYLGHRAGIKAQLTPRENLAWACRCQGWATTSIDAALARVGLAGLEDRICQHLSAGQQRRVNLARLYLSFDHGAPRALWLLDEPFTAIDRAGVQALADTVAAQVARGGAVVLTSHQDLPLDIPLTKMVLGVAA